MKIIKTTGNYSKEISELMLSDLKNPSPLFPTDMIERFRMHAQEENILKEFENPELIAFLYLEGEKLAGFIVGYRIDSYTAMIHYISANRDEIKKELLDNFIKECKIRKINRVTADAFEFMDNNLFFKSQGFELTKKEKLTNNLEMLWYELSLM